MPGSLAWICKHPHPRNQSAHVDCERINFGNVFMAHSRAGRFLFEAEFQDEVMESSIGRHPGTFELESAVNAIHTVCEYRDTFWETGHGHEWHGAEAQYCLLHSRVISEVSSSTGLEGNKHGISNTQTATCLKKCNYLKLKDFWGAMTRQKEAPAGARSAASRPGAAAWWAWGIQSSRTLR